MTFSNSSLVSYTKLSPNHSGTRTHCIDRITPHCVVGQCGVAALGNVFASSSAEASSNYGIGSDGRVGMYVEEKNRSWCSSSAENDQRAVTIECASDSAHPYAFRDIVYQKLIALCADICKRYGKKKLIWIADKSAALAYSPNSDEMLLTVHRWFSSKSCPGDWMYARMGDLAEKVTARLSEKKESAGSEGTIYRIQLGAFKNRSEAEKQLVKVKQAGFGDAFITVSSAKNASSGSLSAQIKIGSLVKIKNGAKAYNGATLASFVYERVYKVTEISGDRVVVSFNGSVVAAVKMTDLTLA